MKVELTENQIKWIHTALYHQWHNMTDDDGKAVNCKQENADGTYKTMTIFEDLLNKIK